MIEKTQELAGLLREWQRMYNAMDSKHEDKHPTADSFSSLRERTHAALSHLSDAQKKEGAWKSLTDREWVNIVNSDEVKNEGGDVHGAVCEAFKLIEAKLREKNCTPPAAAEAPAVPDYREGVNIDRLREALLFLGIAGAGQEETAARLSEFVNHMTLGVMRLKESLATPTDSAVNAGEVPSDEELVNAARTGFDDYWHEDCDGKDSEAWLASTKAVLALLATKSDSSEPRACTCHPDDRPEKCQHKFAASDCQASAQVEELRQLLADMRSYPVQPWMCNWLKRIIAAIESAQPQADAGVSAVASRNLRAIFNHWNEFGPENGFGELIDRLQSSALTEVVDMSPPPGFVLVPIEPTLAILSAMAEVDGYMPEDRDRPGLTLWEDYWRLGIAAATAGISPAPKEQT